MQGKVLSFEEALNQQKQQSQHEEECSHCKFLANTTTAFVNNVKGLPINSDAFAEEVENLIGFVEMNTRANTLREIGIGLIHASDDIFEDDEEGYDDCCDGDCGCEYDE